MTEPPKKKRKLPSLDESLSGSARPGDSPDLHQGRKRSIPHQTGQWAAHVYIELTPTEELLRLLTRAIKLASAQDSALIVHPLLPSEAQDKDVSASSTATLHISLSRPLMLQTNQRDELRLAVQKVAGACSGIAANYATFSWLENDDKTRRFLAVETGGGYDKLKAVTARLDGELVKLRQPPYYESPRFHTSIAWSPNTSDAAPDCLAFDDAMVQHLTDKLGDKLRREELWVGALCVKIGKNVYRYPLSK